MGSRSTRSSYSRSHPPAASSSRWRRCAPSSRISVSVVSRTSASRPRMRAATDRGVRSASSPACRRANSGSAASATRRSMRGRPAGRASPCVTVRWPLSCSRWSWSIGTSPSASRSVSSAVCPFSARYRSTRWSPGSLGSSRGTSTGETTVTDRCPYPDGRQVVTQSQSGARYCSLSHRARSRWGPSSTGWGSAIASTGRASCSGGRSVSPSTMPCNSRLPKGTNTACPSRTSIASGRAYVNGCRAGCPLLTATSTKARSTGGNGSEVGDCGALDTFDPSAAGSRQEKETQALPITRSTLSWSKRRSYSSEISSMARRPSSPGGA